MKTLTIRLDKELSAELEKIMKLRRSNTAAGAIKNMIEEYLLTRSELNNIINQHATLLRDLEKLADLDQSMKEARRHIIMNSKIKDNLIDSYLNDSPF